METIETASLAIPSEIKELSSKVSATKQSEVASVLNQIFAGTDDWQKQVNEIEVKDINDKMSISLAETARINAKKARLSAEKLIDAKRDEVQSLKADYDLQDKLWLKTKQIVQLKFRAIEELAEYKANFVKRYEAEQKELRTLLRIEKVSKFTELNRVEFENMSDQMFEIFISGIEKAHNDKIELEQKAEAERLERIENERKENERIRLENERLQKEAIEKERLAEIERKRIEKERETERKKQAEILEAQQKEAERLANIEAEKQAKIQAELKEEADAERLERRKLEIELNNKKQAEYLEQIEKDKIEKSKLEAEKKAKNAPEKEKLLKFALTLKELERPQINTDEAKQIMNDVNALLSKVCAYIETKSVNL